MTGSPKTPPLKLCIYRIELELDSRADPAVHAVFAGSVGQVLVLAAAATQIEAQPFVKLETVLNVQHVLGLFHAGGCTFHIDGDVVIGIEFLVALTEPRRRNGKRVVAVGPAQFQPQVQSVCAATVAHGIVHKIGVGVVGLPLFAVVAAVVPATGVLQERKPAVVGGRVGADHLETPGVFAKAVGLDLMEIAHHVVQNRTVRPLVVVFAYGAVDVFHVDLAVEFGAVRRLVAKFQGRHGGGIACSVVVVPIDEGADGTEFQGLAPHHALLHHIGPELVGLYAKTVEHQVLDVVSVGAITLVRYLSAGVGAFLVVGLGAYRRAARRVVRHIAEEPRVQGAEHEIVTENAGGEFPVDTVVVGRASHQDVVLGDFQIVGAEAAELHETHAVVPLGIGVVGHVDVQLAGLVGEIRFPVVLIPGLQILAERRFQKHLEILVTCTEAKRKERVN